MAENANTGLRRARFLALALVLAGALLVSSRAVQSQQAPPMVGQPKETARSLFIRANLCQKAGDYEKAAELYAEVQRRQIELNPTDRKDLQNWIQNNNKALQGRRDGGLLLMKAKEMLQLTPARLREAEDYYNKAKAIPYTDKNLLQVVYQEISQNRHGAPAQTGPVGGSPKTMLAEGRNAYRRAVALNNQSHPEMDQAQKELEKAMGLAVQAKNAWTSKFMFPWQDNPDKLMKDIQKEWDRMAKLYVPPDGPPRNKNFFEKLLHRDPPPPTPPDKNGAGTKTKAGGNDGPILLPVNEPGKDKTSKKTEPTSPLQAVKNLFGGGAAKDKDKDKNPPAGTAGAPTDNKTTAKDNGNAVKPGIQVASNSSVPPPLPAKAQPAKAQADPKANNAQARQLIQKGYEALQAKDYESARRYALQAKELRPDLEWFEQNPERLLADIQKRDPGTAAAAITPVKANTPAPAKVATTPTEKEEQARAKAKELVLQGRDYYKKNKLDEADKLCALAAGVPGVKWGLFEDSPEKLRQDIQKARSRRDRDEAARLVAEARALYKEGKYQEAKTKAWQAEKLHGAYSIWDLGDRPQKVLADIEQAESKKAQDATAKNGAQPESKVTPKNINSQVAKVPEPNNNWSGKPPAESEAKAKARLLLAESRALMQQGQLAPARDKALAAQNLRVAFTVGEDTPAAVLQDLGQMCVVHLDGYMKRAAGWVGNPADPARFQKADADLGAARALAVAFQLDTRAIDDCQARLHQSAPAGTDNPPPPSDTLTVVNRIGLDKLDKARMELKAGNVAIARRLAEDAFDAQYGVQQEAAKVMRLIDAEEYNQFVLSAVKNMQAGMEAFQRHDFLQARSILSGIDPRLLDPERQRLLREVLSHPDLLPVQKTGGPAIASDLQQIRHTDVQLANAPGKAHVDDMARPNGDAFTSVHAMEDILFQKLREESLGAQKQAMAQVKSGDTAAAVETLKDFLGQLDRTQLEPEKLSLIKKQIENRMQQYHTILAQDNLAKASVALNSTGNWDEGANTKKILKTQEQVVQLMDQYRALMKEGKYKDAQLAALKAKELDPDNVAVIAALRIAAIEKAQKEHEVIRDRNADAFLEELNGDQGPYVNIHNPMAFDQERLKNLDKNRKGYGAGISSFNHNAIERDIERKLTRPISVNFQKTPLSNVIRDLQALSGVNIVLDTAALNEANVGLDQPLSLSVEHISMKCILNLLLKQVNLTYVIKNEVLNITTESSAKGGFTQVVYPVADLVVPPENHPIPDVMNFEKILERHIANSGTYMSGNTPMQGPFGLANGQSVSSPGAMGNPVGASPASSNDFVRNSRTMEDQLIKLITNTIAPETWESAGGPGKIQFFPLGMQLVIAQQTQDVQEQVQELLAALRRLQDLEVAIEMKLVSVSEAFFEKIGVNFSMNIPTHNSQSIQNQLLSGQFQPAGLINTPFPPSLRGLTSGLTPAGTLTPDLGVPISTGSFAFSNPPFGGFPATSPGGGGLALGLAFFNDIEVSMFLEAAQGDRRTNIMQAPKITVFNGQTASLNVNTTQFFLLGVNVATSPFGQLIITPQQQPFPLGVFLTVTPVVSADRRFVRLNMTPNMTNLVDATVPLIPLQVPVPSTFFGPGNATTSGAPEQIFTMFFQQPSISSITLNTTVNVPDGGTVLLGGLKTLSEGRNEFGPPILSKIPYISRLFKNVAYGREAQSLMIMVTPRIIINEEEERVFIGLDQPIPRP